MMMRMSNSILVELTPEEEAELLAEEANVIIVMAKQKLNIAKKAQKKLLVDTKLESLLSTEFTEIDNATTVDDVKKVKIK